jgi:hypothetical protein
MHCQKNTCSYLQSQTQACLNTIIIVSIQIRWCWIPHQVILQNCKTWLIPKTSTQFERRMKSSCRHHSFLRSILSHFIFIHFFKKKQGFLLRRFEKKRKQKKAKQEEKYKGKKASKTGIGLWNALRRLSYGRAQNALDSFRLLVVF